MAGKRGDADAGLLFVRLPGAGGIREAKVGPADASYSAALHEFTLSYEAVRIAESPDAALLEFAQGTYDAASTLAKWDREMFEERAIKPGNDRG